MDMDNDAPAAGTRLNPILLPESPPLAKHVKKIIGGPPSSIEPPSANTREAVLRRIRELEDADVARILTPATNRAPVAGSSNTRDELVHRPRTILALEASLLESRTAVRSAQAARMGRILASISGPAQYPGPRRGENVGTARLRWGRIRRGKKSEDQGISRIAVSTFPPTDSGEQRNCSMFDTRKDAWTICSQRCLGRMDPDGEEDLPDTVSTPATVLGKRKEYASTVDPMSIFRPMKAFFLDELLRHEGLGDDQHLPHCALCEAMFEPGILGASRLFKCNDCGDFLQCGSCCLDAHARTPLHTLREWNGSYWVDATLAKLGLVYQLGHGGFPCPFPDDAVRNMTVIEAPFIHQIRFQYCKCDKSDDADNLEQLMRNAWYPATGFHYRSATRNRYHCVKRDDMAARTVQTIPTDGPTVVVPEASTSSQARHDPEGVEGPNRNWRDVDPKYQFLYMLIIAVDANFRLKNRMRANEIDDPSLGPGWGYWVDPEKYANHVRKYVNEKDVSTCIAFAALLQKDTRITTGLRVSGVGGVVCARHECMRPNGLGNLQKGERFRPAAPHHLLRHCVPMEGNLLARMEKLPADMRIPLDSIKLQCALPVWHAASHVEDCQNQNSLSFKEGVGKTDGEGVERTWSVLNGPLGDSLQRKLVVAIAERDKQISAFKEVNKTVSREVRASWEDMIEAWVKDDTGTVTNPLCWRGKDEDALNMAGKAPLMDAALRRFFCGNPNRGLSTAYHRATAGTVLVAADRENKIQEWRHALLAKLVKFRNLQAIYMPGAAAAIAEAEEARDAGASPPKPELVQLFMPSDLAALGLTDALKAFPQRECHWPIQATKARTLIGQLKERVEGYAKRYHKGHGALRALTAEDVRLDGDNEESDTASRKKLSMMGSGKGARAPRNAPGTSRRLMSWIWTAPGALDSGEERLHDSIRVEWVRAWARKVRWTEEVMLLREEMRRVLRYLAWQTEWWRERRALRTIGLLRWAGAHAYALKQAAWHERLGGYFRMKWNIPVATVTQQWVADSEGLGDLFGQD
ncbi:hypothetical protein B0H13DRAFT_1894675 [Mycena leptocephala]|nr:hypothetical protein B0H13DRAFT_1894675 [Mycena leptocephala]